MKEINNEENDSEVKVKIDNINSEINDEGAVDSKINDEETVDSTINDEEVVDSKVNDEEENEEEIKKKIKSYYESKSTEIKKDIHNEDTQSTTYKSKFRKHWTLFLMFVMVALMLYKYIPTTLL